MSDHQMDFNTLYSEALAEFESCNYDAAVGKWIRLFEAGFNREAVLTDLYQCFITPNESEFAENYLRQTKNLDAPPYADLAVDFIPVSDTEYYIFNKKNVSFCGKIDLNPYLNRRFNAKTFQSLLICGLWNPAQFLQQYHEKEWQNIYICLQENCEELFYSFFKLPDFSLTLDLNRTKIFADKDAYFSCLCHDTSCYLPHVTYGKNIEVYQDITQKIREFRLSDPSLPRENIFLTIAIPSYNRGSIALESIRQLMILNYDSEIEFLVSNNGSTQNTDGYREIASIEDSRITYFAFEENRQYAGNIMNVLSMGKGRYIMIASDEDRCYLQNFDDFLDLLYNHPDAGLILPSGTGENMFQRPNAVITDLSDRLASAFSLNYVTGLTFNASVLKTNNAAERIQKVLDAGNLFTIHYTHIIYALLACEKNALCSCDIYLWGSPDDQKEQSSQEKILSYMRPQNRLEQMDSSIELIFDALDISYAPDTQCYLFYQRMVKTFWVLFVAFRLLPKAMTEEYDWIDTCVLVWEHNRDLIAAYRSRTGDAIADILSEQNTLLLKEYLAKNPPEAVQTPEQLRSYQERSQKLLQDFP